MCLAFFLTKRCSNWRKVVITLTQAIGIKATTGVSVFLRTEEGKRYKAYRLTLLARFGSASWPSPAARGCHWTQRSTDPLPTLTQSPEHYIKLCESTEQVDCLVAGIRDDYLYCRHKERFEKILNMSLFELPACVRATFLSIRKDSRSDALLSLMHTTVGPVLSINVLAASE